MSSWPGRFVVQLGWILIGSVARLGVGRPVRWVGRSKPFVSPEISPFFLFFLSCDSVPGACRVETFGGSYSKVVENSEGGGGRASGKGEKSPTGKRGRGAVLLGAALIARGWNPPGTVRGTLQGLGLGSLARR